MAKFITAYYSKKTGKRVTDSFAASNPNSAFSLSLDANFLRGKLIKVGADGMPATWADAEKAKLAWDTHQAKLEARRAKAKAKKLGVVAALATAAVTVLEKAGDLKKGKPIKKPAKVSGVKKMAAAAVLGVVTKAAQRKAVAKKAKKLAQPLPAAPSPLS